jgi:hypothetical protein
LEIGKKLEKKKNTDSTTQYNNIIIDFVDHELKKKKNIKIQNEFIIEKKKILHFVNVEADPRLWY